MQTPREDHALPGQDIRAWLVLRLGLAVVLLWFAVSELLEPSAWTVYLPSFLRFASGPLMMIHGLLLLVAGALLLAGLYTRLAGWVASAILMIVLASLALNGAFDSVFVRDIGLAAACLAVASSPSCARTPGLGSWRKRGAGRVGAVAYLVIVALTALAVIAKAPTSTATSSSASFDDLGGLGGLASPAPAMSLNHALDIDQDAGDNR